MGKKTPKPLFALKADFVESLNNFTQASLNLWQAVDIFLMLNKDVKGADVLRERAEEWKRAASEDF